MNVQRAPTAMAECRDLFGSPRWHGYQPLLARSMWLALIGLTLAISLVSLPAYLTQLQAPCGRTACEYQQLTSWQVEALKGIGISLEGYTAVTVALMIIALALCWGVSALIVWRRPEERMAVLVALLLVALGPLNVATSLPAGPSPWTRPHSYLVVLAQSLIILVFLLFPSGRFAPHWMRWTFVALLVMAVLSDFVPTVPLLPYSPSSSVGWFVTLVQMAIVAGVQLYRYRRISSPIERQQAKWVAFGFAAPVTAGIGLTVLSVGFPALAESSAAYVLVFNEGGFLFSLCPSLAFGFAMLRYRLWDVDVLINRTLVYGTLTAILALVYGGGVIGIQTVMSRLIHGSDEEQSPLIIVITTLVIVALFRPLRRHLQTLIDRRFFRRKYDAARTLARFGETLRSHAELETLTDDLMAAANETMQPTHVTLWLRPRISSRSRFEMSRHTRDDAG
jgi:hypothetical protein